MTSTISWDLYRSLLAVLREGTLCGAARALGITQPTVGRHIAALEQALEVVLFTRSQAGLMPTAVALSLQTYAQTMESTTASLQRAALSQEQGVSGVVRVSASDVISVEVLPAIIAQLRDQYPGIRVELVLTDRVQNLLQREADIAVRMVRPDQQQLIARRIGEIEIGLYAHHNYLSRHGEPNVLSDLTTHSVIGYDQPTAFVRKVEESVPGFNHGMFSLRTDSNVAQLALIRAGAGIGVCQTLLATRDQGLVRVLENEFAVQLETWVTMHEDLRSNPSCRATFDTLVEGLKGYIG